MSPDRSPTGSRRLLLVAPNWLGDLVMFTSLLGRIRRLGGGDLHISVAVRRRWQNVLAGDPRIDQLLLYEREGLHHGLGGAWRLAGDWRAARFTESIIVPPSFRAAAVAALAGIPGRIGYQGDARSFFLTQALPRPPRGVLHYTQELERLRAAWAATAPSRCLDLPTLPALESVPTATLGVGGREIWALGIGATYGEAKGWTSKEMASFVEMVHEDRDRQVLLLGDAQARSMADALCRRDGRIINRVGATDLLDVTSLLKQARIYVGSDSGLMHLSAALGTPTVGLFGSTSTVWTGPRGAWTAIARAEGFACQPCYRRRCNQDRFCMESLTAAQVHVTCSDLLDSKDTQHAGTWRPVTSDAARPTLFLDRDGVIVQDSGYLSEPAQVRLIPGVVAGLKAALAAGYRLVCLTNQSGIGRGYYDQEDFAAVQTRIDQLLAEQGIQLDGVYYCPHAPEARCACRKPLTGLLDAVAGDCRWTVDSWMIGDKSSDVLLARNAGLQPALVLTGEGVNHESAIGDDVGVYPDLQQAIAGIIGGDAG